MNPCAHGLLFYLPCWRHEVEGHKEMAYRYQRRAENLEATLTHQSPPDATPAPPNENMMSWRSEAVPLASEALDLLPTSGTPCVQRQTGEVGPAVDTPPRDMENLVLSRPICQERPAISGARPHDPSERPPH